MIPTIRAADLVQYLESLADVIGTGDEPDGLCEDRTEHRPHLHDSETLGRFWCTADQSRREPYRSERRRMDRAEVPPAETTTPSLILTEASNPASGGTGDRSLQGAQEEWISVTRTARGYCVTGDLGQVPRAGETS
jgi:hypothetical protein